MCLFLSRRYKWGCDPSSVGLFLKGEGFPEVTRTQTSKPQGNQGEQPVRSKTSRSRSLSEFKDGGPRKGNGDQVDCCEGVVSNCNWSLKLFVNWAKELLGGTDWEGIFRKFPSRAWSPEQWAQSPEEASRLLTFGLIFVTRNYMVFLRCQTG